MRRMRTVIEDETGYTYDYEDAARALGITENTARQRVWQYRKANGYPDTIRLDALRPKQRALTVLVIDDRVDTDNPHVFPLYISALVELVGLSRPTMFRRLKEYRLLYPGQPIKLKAFMRFAHSPRAREAVHRVKGMSQLGYKNTSNLKG